MRLLFKFYAFVVFLFISLISFGQQQADVKIDSLSNKSALELLVLSITTNDISITERTIEKAKKEQNLEVLADAYYIIVEKSDNLHTLLYSDSIIALKDRYSNTLYPANAYYSKGVYYFNQRNFQKATDNFVEAYRYATKHLNQDMLIRSKHSLGLLKEQTKDYKQALTLYRENFEYASSKSKKTISSHDYLNIIFSLATVHNKLKSYDSAIYYNRYGIKESLLSQKTNTYNKFVLNTAETYFESGNYNQSLDSLLKVKPFYENIDDLGHLSITYYYLAKNYFRLKKDKKAISLLKKVDSLFQENNDVRPKIKESYKLLITHFENNSNLKQQLLYTEKLLTLDSILYNNKFYINEKVVKGYEIPVLLESKERIINSLETNKKRTSLFVYGLFIIIIGIITILILVNKKHRYYKKRFEQLMQDKQNKTAVSKPLKNIELNVPKDVLNKILTGLENFEKENNYLDPKTSINSLAKKIGTNANYLSRTVNHYKKKSFSQYINTLRIENAIYTLKTNKTYQKYTLKAIAYEFGFNNTVSFSKAFQKQTGITPSFFLKSIKNIKD